MKKITLLFALLLCFACSDDDSQSSNPSTQHLLNIPEWAQGNWAYDSSGNEIDLSITAHDYCIVDAGETFMCYDSYYTSLFQMSPTEPTYTVTSTDKEYSFITSIGVHIKLVKISNTQIKSLVQSNTVLNKVN